MGNEPRLLLLAIPYHAEIPPFLCAPTQGMAPDLQSEPTDVIGG